MPMLHGVHKHETRRSEGSFGKNQSSNNQQQQHLLVRCSENGIIKDAERNLNRLITTGRIIQCITAFSTIFAGEYSNKNDRNDAFITD